MASRSDGTLVAALILLRDHLGSVVDEILAGDLSIADRRDLARAIRMVADHLAHPEVVVDPRNGTPGR